MTDKEKQQIILDTVERKVWSKAEKIGIENKDRHLVQGIRLTRLRMSLQPTAEKTLNYFWSAIKGTDKSRGFYQLMKRYDLETFEDIVVEIRDTFTDEWLRA